MKTPTPFLARFLAAITFVAVGSTIGLHAQPGSLDTNFNVAITAGHWGYSVAVQPDGKVVAAGTFGVVRLLQDGTTDPAFNADLHVTAPYGYAGLNTAVVALQTDGKVVVAGSFTNTAGAPLPGVMRLNSDGSIDAAFNLDPRASPAGRVLALQPDGKIVTGGFYRRDAEEAGSLVRLLADGSLDPDWSAVGYDGSGDLYSLAVAPDGRIYLGTFTQLVRINTDGSRDGSFEPDPGLGPIGAVALQADGKVLLGGYGDGADYEQVRRLLADGTDDPEWDRPAVAGGDSVIYAILVQPDGKVLVGGNNLMAVNGVPVASLVRLHPDGSVDTAFDTDPELHFYSVEDIALAPDGKLIVAGFQQSWPYLTADPGIWRLHNDAGPRGIEFTAPTYIVHEGDEAAITIRRSGPVNTSATLRYDVQPGTADFGRDYIGNGGVVVFAPGETLKTFRIRTKADRRTEGPETVQLSLLRSIGGALGAQDHATLIIVE
jgi:uncharacterized delta-60 repeat protein